MELGELSFFFFWQVMSFVDQRVWEKIQHFLGSMSVNFFFQQVLGGKSAVFLEWSSHGRSLGFRCK